MLELQLTSVKVRRATLKMIREANSGHPGGSLSCIDVLCVLYGNVMRHDPARPDWPERDLFVLSKGHAAPALYATLAHQGYFDASLLDKLRRFGSPLQGHPKRGAVPGVEVSTGALGVGLSVAVGCALSCKLRGGGQRVHVLLGDGECQEGSVWEAAMAASHYHLDNLVAVVDRNGLQIDGPTEEVMGLEPFASKWECFGWHVLEIDATNVHQLLDAFHTARHLPGRPTVVVAYSVKGHGTGFMEHVRKFHGTPPSDEEFEVAMRMLDEVEENLRTKMQEVSS
ncbi:MAG: transketolase [Promethearchaeota archaeon]